jgi:shikimate dehydrogenase
VGFVEAARANGMLWPERPVLLAGAGGAGTAIAFALAAEGVRRIHIANREPERADQLTHALRQAFPGIAADTDAHRGLREAGLAVNATSLGLHEGDPMPFDAALLPPDAALFDIIAARDTELMAVCAARGLKVIGGKPMIDHQIAAQIAFWRGDAPH